MQNKLSKVLFLSAGAALVWFLDPVSGAERRRKLSDQVSGVSGGPTSLSDPTGGAAPYLPPIVPVPPVPAPVVEPVTLAADLVGDDGRIATPAEGQDQTSEADKTRATLRTSW